MSLRKAYQDMIRVQGIPDTAALMEMTESAMDNRVQERQGQCFSIRQSLRLQQISGLTRFAEEIATLSGGTFIKLPEVGEVENESLFLKFNELHAKLGDLSREFAEATKDGEVCGKERAKLEAIGAEIHRTMQELLALTFAIYCKGGK